MPVFFFFNQDVANLFAGGHNGPPVIRQRDMSVFFPALLLLGSVSGAPQLVLPFALYILLGSQVNTVENVLGSAYAKLGAFILISILMFWDFLPFYNDDDDYTVQEERRRPGVPRAYRFEEPPDEGVVFSALSEMSLVFLISLSLAILSHWEEIHSYIARSLPRSWGRRFREFTRSLGIHPMAASPGQSPATPEAISALETVEFKGSSGEGDCSICLEAFKSGDMAKKLPCKHIFHSVCLMPWLNQRSSCPVCRASVEHSEEDSDRSSRQTAAARSHSRTPLEQRSGIHGGLNAVLGALNSVMDPTLMFNQNLRVEDREALMRLPIRELRERALARDIPLQGVVEKREIVDLILGSASRQT